MNNLVAFKEWPKISRLNRDIVITEKLDGTNAAIGIVVSGDPDSPTTTVYAQSRNRIITPQDDNFGFAGWVQRHREVLIETLGPGVHFGEWWGLGIGRGYGLTERRFSLFNTAKWSHGEGAVALEAARSRGVAIYSVPELYSGPWTGTFGFVDNTVDTVPRPFLTREQMAGGEWPVLQADFVEAERKVAEIMARINRDGFLDRGMALEADIRALIPVNPRPRFAPNFILEWLKGVGSFAAEGFKKPEGIVVFHKASGMMFKATIEKDESFKGKQ